MKVDIFCHVIDFYGDVAVSLRLALAMKRCRPNWEIRYFCDGKNILPKLFPSLSDGDTMQNYLGVEIYPTYRDEFAKGVDVAIEALACELPANYPLPPLIINWEYLTAENWASNYHLNQSYIGGNHQKYFFLPGLKPQTGGLTWGNFIDQREKAYAEPLTQKKLFLEHMALTHLDAEQPWASLYAYKIDAACIEAQKDVLFFAPGHQGHLLPDNCYVGQFLGLDWYDHLVTVSDFNLVRGEDSLSRALLSAKPFLWQAYIQDGDAHWAKIEALLELVRSSFLDTMTYTMLEKQYKNYNKAGYFSPSFFTDYRDELALAAQIMTKKIISLGPQEGNLIKFIEEKQATLTK